jgi:hypothetical protein
MSLAYSKRGAPCAVAGVLCLSTLFVTSIAHAETAICVEVKKKSWSASAEPNPKVPEAWSHAADPAKFPAEPSRGFDPAAYLKRMLEYEVTHEPGFHSTPKDCQQTLQVELYPLQTGWTVFARYSGNAREEKIDTVDVDEFPQLAQRIAFALLRDRPIQETITRENVLRADSEHAFRTIRTRGHALLALGTSVRIGRLDTAGASSDPASQQIRVLTPVTFQLGYRGKFKAWGLDVFGRLSLGTSDKSAENNPLGGHVDFAGSGGLGLHFLRYFDPAGMTSFYAGGGASFELSLFSIVRPEDERADSERDYLPSAGLNLDVLVGYEFLRAASLHFFAEAELQIPTYVVRAESSAGSISTYMPGGLAEIGVLF